MYLYILYKYGRLNVIAKELGQLSISTFLDTYGPLPIITPQRNNKLLFVSASSVYKVYQSYCTVIKYRN